MKELFATLARDGGPLGRARYFLAGACLFLLKHALDWGVASLFGRPWSPFDYFVLPTSLLSLMTSPFRERAFPALLLTVAVPFIFVGVKLTLRRLRDAGLPSWLVVCFFVPLVNLVFFLLLCLLPGRPAVVEAVADGDAIVLPGPDVGRHFREPSLVSRRPSPEVVARFQDDERWQRLRAAHRRITGNRPAQSAALSLVISVPVTVGFVVLATEFLESYGMGVFVGVPFCLGLGSVVLYGLTEPQPVGACLRVAFLAATLTGVCLLLIALEGAICLLMAAPIWFGLALFGGLIGFAIQARPWSEGDNPLVLLALLAASPTLIAAESAAPREPPLTAVVTTVDIDAPPETVWRNVIAFPPLPEPDEWVFHTGVAYPVGATIDGNGPGAVRHCVFSTGPFVEPIETWHEPELLRFRVEDQPEPMREWSPYTIHPPHLHGFLVSHRGQFKLTPLPGGRTRLEGTTWYTNKMWPVAYWRLWSDAIIHRIHSRVLRHIRALSEERE
jgi:uncharacterized membrane protein YhaH (DUF805 family)